jgi:stearoyl-CoA desaturase (Delta-9 desaturase)
MRCPTAQRRPICPGARFGDFPETMIQAKRRAIDIFSMFLLLAMHLAAALVLLVPFSWGVVALAVGGYCLRMFAITAGFHRYFSHRSYKTSRFVQFLLALVGTMAMQNGPLWWASWHRHHHKHSDTQRDTHSPRMHGLWHAHLGWVLDGKHDVPDLANVRDLARFPELRFLERHKWLPLIAYALACLAIGGWAGLVWGFVVSTLCLFHAICLINSLAHLWGSRPYATTDDSRNNAVLALLTLGEGWHNNHHHCMNSARQGFLWWEIDVTYYVIKLFERVGLVWDVRTPRVVAGSRRGAASGLPRVVVPVPVPAVTGAAGA